MYFLYSYFSNHALASSCDNYLPVNGNLTFETSRADNYRNCIVSCSTNEDCKHFEYDINTAECHLYNTLISLSLPVHDHIVKGQSIRNPECHQSIFFGRYTGAHSTKQTPSLRECQSDCGPGCEGWTFDAVESKCYLYPSINDHFDDSSDFISGSRVDDPNKCFVCPPEPVPGSKCPDSFVMRHDSNIYDMRAPRVFEPLLNVPSSDSSHLLFDQNNGYLMNLSKSKLDLLDYETNSWMSYTVNIESDIHDATIGAYEDQHVIYLMTNDGLGYLPLHYPSIFSGGKLSYHKLDSPTLSYEYDQHHLIQFDPNSGSLYMVFEDGSLKVGNLDVDHSMKWNDFAQLNLSSADQLATAFIADNHILWIVSVRDSSNRGWIRGTLLSDSDQDLEFYKVNLSHAESYDSPINSNKRLPIPEEIRHDISIVGCQSTTFKFLSDEPGTVMSETLDQIDVHTTFDVHEIETISIIESIEEEFEPSPAAVPKVRNNCNDNPLRLFGSPLRDELIARAKRFDVIRRPRYGPLKKQASGNPKALKVDKAESEIEQQQNVTRDLTLVMSSDVIANKDSTNQGDSTTAQIDVQGLVIDQPQTSESIATLPVLACVCIFIASFLFLVCFSRISKMLNEQRLQKEYDRNGRRRYGIVITPVSTPRPLYTLSDRMDSTALETASIHDMFQASVSQELEAAVSRDIEDILRFETFR